MKTSTQFKPGQSGSPSTQWQPGQTGNPGGKTRARREFEQAFFAAVCDDQTLKEAVDALKKAIRAGQPWALNLYFAKVLPPEELRLKVSRGDDDDERSFDYSRLSDAEFQELGRLLEKATHDGEKLLESGSVPAESSDVRGDGVADR